MPFGAELLDRGGVCFRLWAPSRPHMTLELLAGESEKVTAQHPMTPQPGGWYEWTVPKARAGQRYRYRVDESLAVPDPASRCNPLDVHGPSEVVDPLAYRWRHAGWRGLPWHSAVVYELHVGSFTPEGTLRAAAARLPQLQALGINTVELMPVADFPGSRGWGYDGVLPFAVEATYGHPDDLKRFVDTAHGLGMMVLLDVVYNHFGPDGNYLHAYAPEFFDASCHTPWGPAIDVDGPGGTTVRSFFIENALYWVEEYRFDGLRLDAVHAIGDSATPHLVAEIGAALRVGPGRERLVHLVLENENNTARWLLRDAVSAPMVATAQWNDDWHHAAHVLATGEVEGYYADFAQTPAKQLGCALAAGFVYQGQASGLRDGGPRGEPSAVLPSQAFVAFLQNHDQIGNRALGERLDALAPTRRVEALLTCLLLAPHVPMLFMGEEFAATTPFLYFCDHRGELAQAVSDGRRAEFAGFPAFRDPAARAAIPDPNARSTFEASKLRWAECDAAAGRRRLALVAHLLSLRREHLLPLLPLQRHGGMLVGHGAGWFTVEWPLGPEWVWCLRANLGSSGVEIDMASDDHEVFRTPAAVDGDPSTADAAPIASSRWLQPDEVQVALRRRAAA